MSKCSGEANQESSRILSPETVLMQSSGTTCRKENIFRYFGGKVAVLFEQLVSDSTGESIHASLHIHSDRGRVLLAQNNVLGGKRRKRLCHYLCIFLLMVGE